MPSIILMDSIKQGRKLDVSFLENAMTLAKDSVKVLSHANSDLTVHRKDLVRPARQILSTVGQFR